MRHPNLDVIDRFFEAHRQRNMDDLKLVLAENARWISHGQPSQSRVSNGFDEVVAFLDLMEGLISKTDGRVEKLMESADDNYVIECLHLRTIGEDGERLDQLVCVLWKFENSKIVEGRHFFADPTAADIVISYISAFQS